MTEQEFAEKQAKMSDETLISTIENKLHKLCETGGKSLTMSVPPHERDFDMAVCELIRRYKQCRTILKVGYVKIKGTGGFERICKESELQRVGKEIFAEHPGADGYYNFTKFLWVNYPDDRPECRLDSLVSYD